MLKWYKKRLLLVVVLLAGIFLFPVCSFCSSDPLAAPDFTIHKKESGRPGHTILIVGGIQGDEPGGFNAASLIVTQYSILSGNVWVVPNLNFVSIIKRSRGVYGDLNRKFDKLHPSDPEYHTICRIKKLITDPKVDLILNLHDGSGFYRKTHIDKMKNPNRWGQCVIIDQDKMSHGIFNDLSDMAQNAVAHVNSHLLSPSEYFMVNNTQTGKGNEEMAKTLTWFALKNNKPAFGLEASKSFLTPKRTYYHLLAIESFFQQAGISFQRHFKLTRQQIKKAISNDIQVALHNRKILLKIENPRKQIRFVPFRKNAQIEFQSNHPLMTIIPSGNQYSVIHGNRRLTHLSPQYFDYDFSISGIEMIVDGTLKKVPFGRIVPVQKQFRVKKLKDHRVNIIGFTRKGVRNESGITIEKDQILKGYSIDKKGCLFRVETYKRDKFSGMILVDFNPSKNTLKLASEKKTPPASGNFF